MTALKRKMIALVYGLLCHSLFLIAISLMAYSLYFGMNKNILDLELNHSWLINLILIIQFPILHSLLLHEKGKFLISFLAPKEYSTELATTVFAIFASLQLILVFSLWTPSQIVLWEPSGRVLLLLSTLYAFSWILLTKSMYDAGLSLQTGMLGWYALFKGSKPTYPTFKESGLNKYCRQAMYLSFAMILIFAPIWTLDHLVLALIWCSYCVVGPRFKEKRALKKYGEVYKEYQSRVPYFNFIRGFLKPLR